ncbi:MAG: 4-(cytidine 5'-diphospho)-2-C-methyl-D-erythritol kinase [Alphaproteobacteria bacterium]|nr:4-(cytidine 5'-diphospho)-2-C-methyl-D-erythritol kinase [Alphaproteobacteria bacterium]MDE2629798.1 4-(cytidine 5'-diphospho)-2-C-methyl-D-erythritol kinase [Alphaproteobacteria bacterium]
MTTVPEPVFVSAPAKINLFLHIGQRRADGFHALESLVVFAGASDKLALEAAGGLSLAIDGPFANALKPDADNLVLKAARALAEQAGVRKGARIVLTKNLPVASGIGGGSADAAAALRGLARLWNLNITQERLRGIGATLGSDVPVCIDSTPAWMEGRGEKVTALGGIPGVAMVLVNPGVGVPTGKVFAALKERRGVGLPLPPAMRNGTGLVAYLKTTANDLEAPAREIAPVIDDVLDALGSQPGALLARMSGSGATCFALFGETEAAENTAMEIGSLNSGWWVVATTTA